VLWRSRLRISRSVGDRVRVEKLFDLGRLIRARAGGGLAAESRRTGMYVGENREATDRTGRINQTKRLSQEEGRVTVLTRKREPGAQWADVEGT
jgi:hypothetical protein